MDMRLDADEYLMMNLRQRSEVTFAACYLGCMLPSQCSVIGRELSMGNTYSPFDALPWRTGKTMMEQRWMDEQIYVTAVIKWMQKHRFIDENLNGLTEWTQHNNYIGAAT